MIPKNHLLNPRLLPTYAKMPSNVRSLRPPTSPYQMAGAVEMRGGSPATVFPRLAEHARTAYQSAALGDAPAVREANAAAWIVRHEERLLGEWQIKQVYSWGNPTATGSDPVTAILAQMVDFTRHKPAAKTLWRALTDQSFVGDGTRDIRMLFTPAERVLLGERHPWDRMDMALGMTLFKHYAIIRAGTATSMTPATLRRLAQSQAQDRLHYGMLMLRDERGEDGGMPSHLAMRDFLLSLQGPQSTEHVTLAEVQSLAVFRNLFLDQVSALSEWKPSIDAVRQAWGFHRDSHFLGLVNTAHRIALRGGRARLAWVQDEYRNYIAAEVVADRMVRDLSNALQRYYDRLWIPTGMLTNGAWEQGQGVHDFAERLLDNAIDMTTYAMVQGDRFQPLRQAILTAPQDRAAQVMARFALASDEPYAVLSVLHLLAAPFVHEHPWMNHFRLAEDALASTADPRAIVTIEASDPFEGPLNDGTPSLTIVRSDLQRWYDLKKLADDIDDAQMTGEPWKQLHGDQLRAVLRPVLFGGA